MPADVVEQIKKTFPVSEWVEVQTVKGYFSRLASQQKGLPVSEEEGEDEALEKEDYMEQLVGVAEQEIGLKHPLVYDDFNFCDLSAGGRLAKVLEKQNSVSFSHSASILTWKFLVVLIVKHRITNLLYN